MTIIVQNAGNIFQIVRHFDLSQMGMSFHRQQTIEQGNWQNFIHALLLMLLMYHELDFSTSKKWLICAKVCEIIESKSSKERNHTAIFKIVHPFPSAINPIVPLPPPPKKNGEIPVLILPLQDPVITISSLKEF